MGENPKIYALKPYKSSAKRKPSNLVPSSKEFLDKPAPEIIFQGRSFCFTGVFDFANGDRNQCEIATKAHGGFCYERPNHALNYLVVGNYAEPSWAHQSFGRKIMAVLEFKRIGAKCLIVSEEQWTKSLQTTPESPQDGQTSVQGHSRGDQLIQLQKDLDKLRKDHQFIIGALKDGLTAKDYRKLAERLGKSGVVI
jgi:hypothetical protein